MAAGTEYAGVVQDDLGVAISGVTVELYAVDESTTALETDTTDAAGEYDVSRTAGGRYDLKIINGDDIIWIRARDQYQVSTMAARSPVTAEPAGHFMSTTNEAATLVGVFAGRRATESSGVETAANQADGDIAYIDLELANDNATPQQFIAARLAWEAVDVSDGTEDGQFNFWVMKAGTLTEVLHLDSAALVPQTTDEISLGTSSLNFSDLFLDSGAVIDFDSGDVKLTHSANFLKLAGGDFSIAATSKLYLDGGGNTYIYEESSDDLHIVVGGGIYLQIDQALNVMGYGLSVPMFNAIAHNFSGAFTSGGAFTASTHVKFTGELTGADGDTESLSILAVDGAIITQTASENVGVIASVLLREPTITDNLTGDITVAATLYVENAPTEGETNAAIYVAAGNVILNNGSVFIGDDANAKMTVGLTINQGANDDEILALKSSDVGHPMTDIAEADTFGVVQKNNAAFGGVSFRGFTDSGGSQAFSLVGNSGDATPDATDTISSTAIIQTLSQITNGSAATQAAADADNIFAIRNATITRILVKGNGALHVTNRAAGAGDVVAAALADDFDDVMLVRAHQRSTYDDVGAAISKWDEALGARQDDLKRLGVISSTGDFRIVQRYEDLLGGAIWQNYQRHMSLVEEVDVLKSQLKALTEAK